MSDIIFKELRTDNIFDFCEVIAAIGFDKLSGAVDLSEIANMQDDGDGNRAVGIAVAVKVFSVVVQNLGKARNEVYAFFAGCTEYKDGAAVDVNDIGDMKPSAFMRLIKDFTKLEGLTDFFEEVVGFFKLDPTDSKN